MEERKEFLYDPLVDKNIRIASIMIRATPIMEALTGIMIAILIFYSGILISSGDLDINNFFSFLAAMMLAYQPVRALSTLNMTIKQGLSAAIRILPIIDNVNKITDVKDAKPLVQKNSDIKFINLDFAYEREGNAVLKNINLDFEGGKMTSLVGHSGSGKSTILNLIPRFYDADSGDIEIDNQSIYQASVKSLRQNISLVTQETTLFDDTILNNIKYSRENATNEEVYEVARLSNCDEFIDKEIYEKFLMFLQFQEEMKKNELI